MDSYHSPPATQLTISQAPEYRSNEESWLDVSPVSPATSSTPTIDSRFNSQEFDFPIPPLQNQNESQDSFRPIIDSEYHNQQRKSWLQRRIEARRRPTTIYSAQNPKLHEKWHRRSKDTIESTASADTIDDQKAIKVENKLGEGRTWDTQHQPTAAKRHWYQHLNPLKWGPVPPLPLERKPCPEFTTNPFTRISFGWMTPLMATGYRRNLEQNDIWLVDPKRNVHELSKPFDISLHNRLTGGSNRTLLMALYDTFRRDFWIGGICLFISSIGQVMVPFTLRFLLSFISEAYDAMTANRPSPSLSRGLGLVFGIVFIQCIQSLMTNQFMYHGAMVGAQARGVLTTAIFEKSLKISTRARTTGKGYSDGVIMNLMSTDVARIDLAAGMLHMIWAAPLTIFACLVLLIINITYSAIAGFSLLAISIPALTFATKSLAGRRKTISTISDSRVSLTTEVLKSIRFVKYNAWESSFLEKVTALRKKETKLVAKLLTTRNAIYVISISTPVFAAMLSFIVYSMTGHALGVGPVFSSLALFNAVRIPLSLLPMVIGQMADAMACVKRIEDFLLAEEHQEDTKWDAQAEHGIQTDNACFIWEKCLSAGDAAHSGTTKVNNTKTQTEIKMENVHAQPFSMKKLNFTVGRSELLAVIGTVGSGKTSLLSALAGEMRKTSGSITIGSSSRAFCPQEAWIQNATVKDNILFGKPLESWWYNAVKNACCLQADLQHLSAGEDTEIGERGINLSGGQRQRINLARAIYSNSDIVLLDDPLSAVDVHVGKHLFEHAICGLLRDKCRILATHQLHILNRCDRILWLENGKIRALDTFDNLMQYESEFRTMMANTTQESNTESGADSPSLEKVKSEPVEKPAENPKQNGKLVKEESKGEGHVSWAVYKAYIDSSGHLLLGFIPVILLILAQVANAVMGLWLGFWTSNHFNLSRDQYIAIYVGLACSQALLMFLFTASVSNLGSISSRRTLDRATEKVVRSPQSFHDTQPLGRIVNRLSRDADVVDNQLPDALRMFLYTMVLIASVVAMLIYYFPYFAAALVPIIGLFLFATSYFRVTARSLKRHEAVLRGKVAARVSESISGIPTIRAYGLQMNFAHTVRESINDMNSAYYLTNSSQRWLATRLDLVANIMVLTIGLLVVAKRDVVHPSISGVLLAYLLSMIHVIQLVVRQLTEVQTGMTSMERLHEYATALPTEPCASPDAGSIQPSWPQKGEIVMKNVCMRYRPDLPLVLDNLSMKIGGGEKIGIVGRTGAGKSTITAVLFRLVELTGGAITIDGVDISSLALKDLRSRISIITQDPTLFKGTIRSNLDPFDRYTDLDLYSALRKAGLLDDEKNKLNLETPVEESGSNFSLGQRQLLALARCLLKNSQIVVCDEATSSVDMETDAKVQRVMNEAFKDKTVITIAHRLKTVIDYDRVCVLEKGKIAEIGMPLELWEREGVFRDMCDGNGIERTHFRRAWFY